MEIRFGALRADSSRAVRSVEGTGDCNCVKEGGCCDVGSGTVLLAHRRENGTSYPLRNRPLDDEAL